MGQDKRTTVMLVAGEASGDRYGAGLMTELRPLLPGVRFTGMGGARMREQGLESCHPGTGAFGTAGLVEVLSRARAVLSAYRAIKSAMHRDRPDLFVPIDFPDFNFRLGRLAHRLGIPVVYFISPQVWAWRRGRIRVLARMVRKMLVIFPFEQEIYRSSGVDAVFVGHPLLEGAGPPPTPEDRAAARGSLGLGDGDRVVVILPGSRSEEIRRILPPMLEGCRLTDARFPGLRFLMVRADALADDRRLDASLIAETLPHLTLLPESRLYLALRAADAAVVTSGTITVETALHLLPMVVVYRVNPLTYLLGRALVDLDNIAMVNLIAGRRVVPELLQGRFTPEALADELTPILADPEQARKMREDLRAVRDRLGSPGAFQRAAMETARLISSP